MADIQLLVGFSPNDQWLAYATGRVSEGQTPSIHLLSAQGKFTTQTPTPLLSSQDGTTIGAWSDARWISNDYLLVALHNPDVKNDDYQRYMLAILDPFQGKWHQEYLEQLPGRYQASEVYFSSDMTRAVYLAVYDDSHRYDLVLWDMQQQKELWRRASFFDDRVDSGLERYGNLNRAIVWSLDNSKFLFTDTDAVNGEPQFTSYLLGRDGGQEQIVNAKAPHYGAITDGVWSPDSRYIAYVRYDANHDAQIMIYDPALDQTIQLCTGLTDPINLPGRSELMWSFDGKQLVYVPVMNGQPGLLALNIQTGIVTEIMKVRTFFPAGWVANEAWLSP